MEHLYWDLGSVKKGATVVVTLRNQANVQLMTSSEYRSYKSGGRYRYLGGRVKRSPYRVTVPTNDHWFVAIDLGGLSGRVNASVAVQPPPTGFLPEAQSQSPVSEVAVREPLPPTDGSFGGRTWDVFMSHASEDKASCARPLRDALLEYGVTVWLDETEMRLGHSLRRRIDEGIRSSRFGVVILSPAFFGKGWTNHELDGLVTRTVAGEQSLLPIWHDVTAEQVRAYSPSLADKVAVSTAAMTIIEIAAEIAQLVREPSHGDPWEPSFN